MSFQTPETIAEAALLAAVAAGCDCDPTIKVTELRPQIFNARVSHDDDCHLMLRRSAGRN